MVSQILFEGFGGQEQAHPAGKAAEATRLCADVAEGRQGVLSQRMGNQMNGHEATI